MREATWTVVLCLLGVGCIGQDGQSGTEVMVSQLEDECFASGRVVGLERGGADDCALQLGTDTTGAWEQTLQGCGDGTAWLDLNVDAEVPAGAQVLVSYRLMQDVIVPVGLPWTRLEGPSADLGAESGEFLDVRVELRLSAEGESPELRGVSVGRVCPLAP